MMKNKSEFKWIMFSSLVLAVFVFLTFSSRILFNGNPVNFDANLIDRSNNEVTISSLSVHPKMNTSKEKDYTFIGSMEATVITHKAYPNFQYPEEETIIEEKFFSYMTMKCSPGSIKKLKSYDFRANILTQGLEYPIFWGKTSRDHANEPQKVVTDIHTKTYNKQFGEFLLYSDIIVNGESNGYDWNFSVSPFARQVTGIQSIDAFTQYCVKLYMSDNMRLHEDPKYKTVGTVTGKERISEDEFQPVSRIVREDDYLGLAQFDCEKQVQLEDRVVIPLIVEAPRTLEEYLLNPTDHFTLELSGKLYSFEEGGEEFEKTIKVKITFVYVEAIQ